MPRRVRRLAGRLWRHFVTPQGWLPVAIEPALYPVKMTLGAPDHPDAGFSGLSVAALEPLSFVAMAPDGGSGKPAPRLGADFVVTGSDRRLASLDLRLERELKAGQQTLGIYRVAKVDDGSQNAVEKLLARRQFGAVARSKADPYNFSMAPHDLLALHVFYLQPRPVVLVSVDDGNASNIFPMDLIGPLGDDLFAMALRTTSPSVQTMEKAGHWAIGEVPFARYRTAYSLGKHHKEKTIDRDSLGIALRASPGHGLPLPAWSLNVRDLVLVDAHTVGSHRLFVTRIAGDSEWNSGPQFHHTSKSLGTWLRRQGQPSLPTA